MHLLHMLKLSQTSLGGGEGRPRPCTIDNVTFLVKEFGLAGFSNLAVVTQTKELITASPAVAGGLYWSLRGHARVRQCDWALACERFVTCSP